MNTEVTPHIISILVENAPGVLSQVARLFSRKGYNIEAIASGVTQDPAVTRITIVMDGTELMIRQLVAQLRKLFPVLSVNILSQASSVQRELILVKVLAETKEARDQVIQVVNVFRASIVDIGRETLTISIVGDEEKSQALLGLLSDFGILEIVRTGTIAIERGRHTIYDENKEKGEFDYGKNVL